MKTFQITAYLYSLEPCHVCQCSVMCSVSVKCHVELMSCQLFNNTMVQPSGTLVHLFVNIAIPFYRYVDLLISLSLVHVTYHSGPLLCYTPHWSLALLHTSLVLCSVTYLTGPLLCYIPHWSFALLHTSLVLCSVTYLTGP